MGLVEPDPIRARPKRRPARFGPKMFASTKRQCRVWIDDKIALGGEDVEPVLLHWRADRDDAAGCLADDVIIAAQSEWAANSVPDPFGRWFMSNQAELIARITDGFLDQQRGVMTAGNIFFVR